MSLPELQWRKLPVRLISTASMSDTLNIIYDMLTGSLYHDGSTRTLGSGSAWQMPSKFVTGSNTEAVYVFPGFQTAISQSVIFSGKSATGAISSATPSVVTNETAYASLFLHGAVVKSASGSFTQWTSQNPFGSGSYSSGYARVVRPAGFVSTEKLTIYESKEAISVVFYNATSNYTTAGVMGALLDPEQSSSYMAESDGRVYGIATSGVETSTTTATLSSTFLSDASNTAGSLFNHSTTANGVSLGYPRFVAFSPGSTSLNPIRMDRTYWVSSAVYVTTTLSGKLVKSPIRCYNTSTNYFAGRLRDISIVRSFPSNLVVKDASNNILGFTLSQSEATGTTNTVLFNYT
jgi:hypothetical protein